jgi:hypothetical protein
MMGEKASAGLQKAHGLWVLHRLGALNEKVCSSAARDGEPLVRVHAMRILSETTPWSQRQDGFAVAGLLDKDPYVQRAAADALGRHPALGHVRPLLDLRAKVPADDAQLLYTVRMALRDQLVPEGTLTRLQNSPLSEADSRAIADVAPGLKSPEVGQFLLQHLQRFSESANKLSDYLRHAARYAPAAQTAQLAALARTKFPDDLDFQLTLFKSIQEGVKQRGEPLAPEFSQWGAELAERLLSSVDSKALDWHNSPMKGRDPTNPWFLQKRASADGDKNSWFVCSLPPGGERFTGILRSKAFVIPPKLSFYLAGHDGYPDKPAQKQNLVRLRSAATQEILATTPAPRNDLAQLSTWDLSGHANESGYLEVIDGDTGAAFAWLAIGRINPPVINLPAMSPRDVDERQRAAAELAASLRLTGLDERLKALAQDQDADTDARAAALKTVVAGNAEPSLGMVRKILFDAEEPAKLREAVAAVLGESGSALAKNILVEAFGTAPLGLQTKLGLALASSSAGAEALLQAVSDGKASARLLQDRNIKDRLAATKIGDVSTRIEKLTANLPRANEERQKLIDARSAAFDVARASAALGMQTFKQHCAICHSLDGQGPVIGPQLDGVGGRGAAMWIALFAPPSWSSRMATCRVVCSVGKRAKCWCWRTPLPKRFRWQKKMSRNGANLKPRSCRIILAMSSPRRTSRIWLRTCFPKAANRPKLSQTQRILVDSCGKDRCIRASPLLGLLTIEGREL